MKKELLLLIPIIFGIYIRFQDLGYSNFQGDEILALLPDTETSKTFLEQLFSQRKGPVQFLFNALFTFLTRTREEAVLRFPYALFGITAIYASYLVSKQIFSRKVGLIVAVLFSLCGLFISFSRIVQYQSLMLLLQFITVLVVIAAFQRNSKIWYVWSGVLTGLLVLLHYDGGALFAFTLSLFLYQGIAAFRKKTSVRIGVQQCMIFLLSAVVCIAVFYVPFYFHSYFQSTTSEYLSGRLLGGGFMPRTAQSVKLLSLYMPKELWYGLFALSIIGVWNTHRKTFSNKKLALLFSFFCVLLFAAAWFSLYPIKPRLSSLIVIMSSVILSILVLFRSQSNEGKIALTHWFLFAFSFYFFFVRDPRTHVYIALIPGFIFVGYAILSIIEWGKRLKLSLLLLFLFSIVGAYWMGYDWVVYVDKTPEHPWWTKEYMGRSLAEISKSKRIDGVFGFNNYRGWEVVADLYSKRCLVGSYESNEKDVITKYYLGFSQLSGDRWTLDDKPDTLIVVEGPHSWMFESRKEFTGYTFLSELSTPYAVPVTRIYGKRSTYPNNTVLCRE